MGWFGNKGKTQTQTRPTSAPRGVFSAPTIALREGTQVKLVNVDEEFIAYARANYPKLPRVGHEIPVTVATDGAHINVFFGGRVVAQVEEQIATYYIDEFKLMRKVGYAGKTNALIKPATGKSSHAISLNWGEGAAYDGGIIGDSAMIAGRGVKY